MLRQARLLKKLRLDAGLDLPSVVEAYREICEDEFVPLPRAEGMPRRASRGVNSSTSVERRPREFKDEPNLRSGTRRRSKPE